MKILMPLPDLDFDVTEVAVPWKLFRDAGHEVVFATEQGSTPAADPLLLTGVLFGQLGAADEPKQFYGKLVDAPEFRRPLSWDAIEATAYDALFLAGGHAPGMKQYLGSPVLADKVAAFWATGRPVGAICHGPIILARAKDAAGKSILTGRKTTCLPKYLERTAYLLTAWKLGRYYRTYDTYVEDEVREALGDAGTFDRGPRVLAKRGTDTDDRAAFVVEDGNYVSARWPGDSYLIAKKLLERLSSGSIRGTD
jgi:putative intracellular protease/amidase